ncbi:MAG: universal stress protein [Myxococcales bacterium]|nr:universal stress protein [Myxococcales bacterium]
MPRGAGRIGWYLVWAVAFGSVGSSMYFVPGLLLQAAGSGAPAVVGLLSAAFLVLVMKEAELTRRHPGGGGAVSQVREVFGPALGTLAGLLLLLDLALTVAVSVVAGLGQLEGAMRGADALGPHGFGVLPLLAAVCIAGIVALAVGGVRGVVPAGLGIGLVALSLNGAVLLSAVVRGGVHPEPVVLTSFSRSSLGLGWLAFSGIEVCALLSPAMKEWASTPTRALAALGIAVLATGPWLMWLIGGLPHDVLRASSAHLLPELAYQIGGFGLSLAVAVAGGGLLFFAAFAAITASYQVQLVLVEMRAWPADATPLSSRFQTPARAVVLSGLIAAAVLVGTGANIRTLGLLYALAFSGSVGLGSLALDVQRWRDGWRGVGFAVGAAISLLLLAGGVGVALAEPWLAVSLLGMVGVGGVIAGLVRSGYWDRAVAAIPGLAPPREIVRNPVQFLTLSQVREDPADAGILVASRGADPRVFREAVDRARQRGLLRVHLLYVDEVPGLLYPQVAEPSDEGLAVLASSCRTIRQLGAEPVPLWAMSHSAALSVAEAVRACGCDTVIIGATQRTVVWQALRGRFVQDLKRALPTHVRITVVG